MKKMNLFVAAAVVALGSIFTSCSKTDNALPTVTFAGTGVNKTGDTLTLEAGVTKATITYTVAAEAEIKTLTQGFGSSLASVKEAIGEAAYGPITMELTGLTNGLVYNVNVVDEDANNITGHLYVKIKAAPTTPLAAATSFSLTYKNNTQTDGANINALTGIKYSKNTGTTGAFLANIEVSSTSNNIVVLADKAAYDAITSKEALIAAYTAGAKVTSFTAATEAAFAKKYIITKTNDVYYLISLDSIVLATSNNVATFSYKK